MVYDPYEAAMNPETRERDGRWFGQLFVDVYACVLQKGVGKVPFDPQTHDQSKRLTAIKMELVPLPEHDVDFTLLRELIAEFGGWPKVTLPSLHAVGIDLRNLNAAWVTVEMHGTGRMYTNSQGEEKEETTFVLLAVFEDQAACRAAFHAHRGQAEPTPATATATAPGGNGNGHNPERATAAMFLNPLWAQASGDLGKFAQLIAANPLTQKHFTLNSPEVVQVVQAGGAA
jgi:hypothetical protein